MSNRHERRSGQAPKVNHIPTYNLNQHQVQEISRKALEEDMKRVKAEMLELATTRLVSTFVIALRETTGFGKKRLSRVLDRVAFILRGVIDGDINIDDMLKECEKLGIDIND